jgi:hypothetical protein
VGLDRTILAIACVPLVYLACYRYEHWHHGFPLIAAAQNLVFATKNGTPCDHNLVVKLKLRPLLESLGIRRRGLHAFRHTNGSLMDRLNTPMKIRQERRGHAPGSNRSNITLAIYTHTVEEDDRLVAEKLGDLSCPNVAKLAQEKIFAVGEGPVIQVSWLRGSATNRIVLCCLLGWS